MGRICSPKYIGNSGNSVLAMSMRKAIIAPMMANTLKQMENSVFFNRSYYPCRLLIFYMDTYNVECSNNSVMHNQYKTHAVIQHKT